ncbi:hypothetical protein D3C76_1657750 [compost metagenome]
MFIRNVPEPVRSLAMDRVWKPLLPNATLALSRLRLLRLELPFICQLLLCRSRFSVPLAGSASRVSPCRLLPWLVRFSWPSPATWASTPLSPTSRLESVRVDCRSAPDWMS